MFKSYYSGTDCSAEDHDHSINPDSVQIDERVTLWFSPHPVKVAQTYDGEMVRRFAIINYWPDTGAMHVTMREGATNVEFESALHTAMGPKQDPSTWNVHPCVPDRRRISLYRRVDEDYVNEVAEEVFEDLTIDMEATDAGRMSEHNGGVAA